MHEWSRGTYPERNATSYERVRPACSTGSAGRPAAELPRRPRVNGRTVTAVPISRGDRWVRWTTTASVVLLAGIAAVVSYRHMNTLALQHGESRWTAALIPLSVDGMIVASSMTLLADSRAGHPGGALPRTLLAIGSTASLAANVAVAEPSMYGRVIAAWPSFALIGAYELLMRQIRHAATAQPGAARPPTADHARSTTTPVTAAASGNTLPAPARPPTATARRLTSPDPPTARPGSRQPDTDHLLARARQLDAEHRAHRGRPASAETLRAQLHISAATARHLKNTIRSTPPETTNITLAG